MLYFLVFSPGAAGGGVEAIVPQKMKNLRILTESFSG
jgi:hypothetical protein